MITSAICIVNGIRSQKPLPHASTVWLNVAGVVSRAATKTIAVASSAKTNASGIHRSVQRVRRAARSERNVRRSLVIRARRRGLQVRVEPGDHAVQPIHQVLLLAQAVRLARVEHEIAL